MIRLHNSAHLVWNRQVSGTAEHTVTPPPQEEGEEGEEGLVHTQHKLLMD